MAVVMKKQDIKTLISLVTEEIDRVGEVKERYGFCDLAYFYHLVDIRNKLLMMPVEEELKSIFSNQEWQDIFKGKVFK